MTDREGGIGDESGYMFMPVACTHRWVSDGGRGCPKGYCDCSQTVYKCAICGACDFGDDGGPAADECFKDCERPI